MSSSTQHFPVTAAITRRPRPGHEEALRHWADGVVEAAGRWPGHLGGRVSTSDDGDVTVVFGFDCAADLLAWESSPERLSWVERAEPLTQGPGRVHDVAGLEAIFAAGAGRPAAAPPRWKTAVVIACGLYPISVTLAVVLGPLTAGWPLPLRSLATVAAAVPLMVWVAVPTVSRLLRRFLVPAAPAAAARR